MERAKKKEIIKNLLNQTLETEEEEELINMLLDNSIGVNVDKEDKKSMRFGDKVADKITAKAGSWGFIIVFIIFLLTWIVLNIYVVNVDSFPFILLNLFLSCVAALQAPIIMMSQNRAAKRDSLRNQNDYRVDLKSELILEELHHQMAEILANQRKILRELDKEDEKMSNK